MYEYQEHTLLHGRVRRQRDTLSTGLFRNRRDIFPQFETRGPSSVSLTSTPPSSMSLYRSAFLLPRQREKRAPYIYIYTAEKISGRKVRHANISCERRTQLLFLFVLANATRYGIFRKKPEQRSVSSRAVYFYPSLLTNFHSPYL